MAEYDRLYMQRHELITGLPIVQPWKVNDDDIEYLLATPKREAADAMYEALKNLAPPITYPSRFRKGQAALDLADGD